MTNKLESLHVVERMINDELASLKESCIRNGHSSKTGNDGGYRMLLNENMAALRRSTQLNEPFVWWMQKVMITVEYLCFELYSNKILRTVKMTQSILFELSSKKSRLKIRFQCFNYILPRFDVTTLIQPIKDLIVMLHSKCGDWSFILYGLAIREQAKLSEIMKLISELNAKDRHNAILNLRGNDRVDNVIRSDCMSGIHVPWITTCNQCTSNSVVFK